MWKTKHWVTPWEWITKGKLFDEEAPPETEQLGWKFACPKCGEISVIPTTEGYEKCKEEAEVPPPEMFSDAWDSMGNKETLTLHPSVVCTHNECTGHYWVIQGEILNC